LFKSIQSTWDVIFYILFLGTVNAEEVLFCSFHMCVAINTETQIYAKENSKSTAHLISEATAIMVKKNDANLS